MGYIGLGRKKATAAADLTGLNTGNLTCVFDHGTLSANVANFEIYHFGVTALTATGMVTVFVENDAYSAAQLLGNAEWDPAQPLLLTPADDVYLCWSLPSSGSVIPVVTAWLRYDPAVQPAQVSS